MFIGSDRSDVAAVVRASGCGRAVAETDFARHTTTPRWAALLAPLLLLAIGLLPLTLLPGSPLEAQVTAEYTVRAGDVLKIRVWPDESLSGEFPVELSGFAYLPIIGEYRAAGLPLSRLQQELRRSYAELMKEPVVSITPVFPVGVMGGVVAPGMYRVEPTYNLMDVIIGAGGFTSRARRDDLRVLRDGRVLRYDARRALETGESELLVLQSGDRIVVPERRGFTLQTLWYTLQLAGTVVIIYNQLR